MQIFLYVHMYIYSLDEHVCPQKTAEIWTKGRQHTKANIYVCVRLYLRKCVGVQVKQMTKKLLQHLK